MTGGRFSEVESGGQVGRGRDLFCRCCECWPRFLCGHRLGAVWGNPERHDDWVTAGPDTISTVSARGDHRFMVHEGSATAKMFREFHRHSMQEAQQPTILVVDGHPIHKVKLITDYLAQKEGKLNLVLLLPYAPELHPDEQHFGAHQTSGGQMSSREEGEIERVSHRRFATPTEPHELANAFFHHPECRMLLDGITFLMSSM